MEESGQLHGSQHAFQKGRSTETVLHYIVSEAKKAIENKEFMISTFMDIEGAFDNITFDAINEHINGCNANTYVQAWIKFMLANRLITYSEMGRTMTVKAIRGTPQGGVLSPLLWIVVMNSLLHKLHDNGFKATGYADDLQISCRGKFLSTLTERTQAAIKLVEQWCIKVGLKVNPMKSDTIIFTKNRKLEGYRDPVLFGEEIKRKKEVKYLGVTLDSKLNWSKHIEERVNKCLRVL